MGMELDEMSREDIYRKGFFGKWRGLGYDQVEIYLNRRVIDM